MYNQIQSSLELLQQTQGLVAHYQHTQNETHYYQGTYRYVSSKVSLGDDIEGGFALVSTEEKSTVYPFTLRLLCTNGAIGIHTEEIITITAEDLEKVNDKYRRFLGAMQPTKAAIHADEDALALEKSQQYKKHSSLFRRLVDIAETSFLTEQAFEHNGLIRQRRLLSRVRNTENRSAFDLINSVTAAGRDEKDPVQKWALEQLGGKLISVVLAWVECETPYNSISLFPDRDVNSPVKGKYGHLLEKERLF